MFAYSQYRGVLEEQFQQYTQEVLNKMPNMYAMLSGNQRDALMQYFRLKTKEEFGKFDKGARLKITPEKTMKLSELTQGLDDWEYDGCIDTGVMGGGMCSLGHQLRYEHWAKSAGTGRELVFGSKCAGDFFDISADDIKRLDKVRAETLDEIRFCVYLMYCNKVQDYAQQLYNKTIMLCKDDVVNEKFTEMLGPYKKCTYEMLKCGIPLPGTIVDIVQKLKVWYNNEYQVTALKTALENALRKSGIQFLEQYNKILKDDVVDCSLNKMIKSTGIFEYNIDEIVKAVQVSTLLENNKYLVEEFDNLTTSELFCKKIGKFIVCNGEHKRKATLREVEEKSLAVSDVSSYVFKDDANKCFAALKSCFVMNDKRLKAITGDEKKEYLISIANNGAKIEKAIKMIEEYADKFDERIKDWGKQEFGKPTNEIPEVTELVPFKEVYEYIQSHPAQFATNHVVTDILEKGIDIQRISLKQGQVMRKAFNKVTGNTQEVSLPVTWDIKEWVNIDCEKPTALVYLADRKGESFGVCMIDEYNRIVSCFILDTNVASPKVLDTLGAMHGVKYIKNMYTYIYDHDTYTTLKNLLDINNNVEFRAMGREISNYVTGTTMTWAKFKDINTYVRLDNSKYLDIIRMVNGAYKNNNEKFLLTNTLVIACAIRKVSIKKEQERIK